METVFSLPSAEGYTLYGLLNPAGDVPARKLVIIAPGLGCSSREHLYVEAVRHLNARGYDVVRLEFYGNGTGARRLEENSTLTTQAADLNTAVGHFSGIYPDIFVAGHSYGGLSALMANPDNVRAISFWDTTLCPDTAFDEDETIFEPDLGVYRYESFVDILINPEMVHQGNALTDEDLDHMAAKIKTPVQLLYAEDGTPRPQEQSFFDAFAGPKERAFLSGADHFFTTDDSAKKAIGMTALFFEKHITSAPSSIPKPPAPPILG